jgi:hypothetical protein
MDASLLLNTLAVGTSFIALLASALLAHRQVKVVAHGNAVPVIVELFREVQTSDFLKATKYIRNRLRSEHSIDLGVNALPEEALSCVLRVCGLYEDIGKLVAFGIIDEVDCNWLCWNRHRACMGSNKTIHLQGATTRRLPVLDIF